MSNMASYIRVFYPSMLATRIRTIHRLADEGLSMRALKAISMTIYNLNHAITPKMNEEQINRYLSFLYACNTYANRGDCQSLKHLVWRLYEHVLDEHEDDMGDVKINELPNSVAKCIKDFVAPTPQQVA